MPLAIFVNQSGELKPVGFLFVCGEFASEDSLQILVSAGLILMKKVVDAISEWARVRANS